MQKLHNETVHNSIPSVHQNIHFQNTADIADTAPQGLLFAPYHIHVFVWTVPVGEFDGKRSLGRTRLRLENDTKWIFKKLDGKAWAGLIWIRWQTIVNVVMELRVP
jgi:hypothetical protein